MLWGEDLSLELLDMWTKTYGVTIQMKLHWRTFYVVLSVSSNFTNRNFDFFVNFYHVYSVESSQNYFVYHRQIYIL